MATLYLSMRVRNSADLFITTPFSERTWQTLMVRSDTVLSAYETLGDDSLATEMCVEASLLRLDIDSSEAVEPLSLRDADIYLFSSEHTLEKRITEKLETTTTLRRVGLSPFGGVQLQFIATLDAAFILDHLENEGPDALERVYIAGRLVASSELAVSRALRQRARKCLPGLSLEDRFESVAVDIKLLAPSAEKFR